MPALPVGDANNTYRTLTKSLRQVGISSKDYRVNRVKEGDPEECTRLLRHVLLHVSLEVSTQVLPPSTASSHSHAITDKRFVNIVFRYLREQSKYFPALSPVQYHLKGFGEHKMCIIDAAAKHVAIYLQNGGARVPSASLGTSRSSRSWECRSPEDAGTKKGRRRSKSSTSKRTCTRRQPSTLGEPVEYSEDISEEVHVHSPINVNGNNGSFELSPSQEGGVQEDIDDEDEGGEGGGGGGGGEVNLTFAWQDETGQDIEKSQDDYQQLEMPSSHLTEDDVKSFGSLDINASGDKDGEKPNKELAGSPRVDSSTVVESEFLKAISAASKSLTHSSAQEGLSKPIIGTDTGKPFVTRNNVENELSAIMAARDDLFADSVYSCEANLVRRDEVVLLMERTEARLRAEYMMAINILGDRVRHLEEALYADQIRKSDHKHQGQE